MSVRGELPGELDAVGVALYSDQQAIDNATPTSRAIIQIASVLGEQQISNADASGWMHAATA
jgi:hypothetical protein